MLAQSLFDDELSAPAFPPAPTMMPTAFSINVPSKTANAAAPAATTTTKPQLLGLLQTLPHSVTTFSVSLVAFRASRFAEICCSCLKNKHIGAPLPQTSTGAQLLLPPLY